MKHYLQEKRDELIWALSIQGFNNADIGAMFNVNRSTVLRIVEKKPKDYKVKWKKV